MASNKVTIVLDEEDARDLLQLVKDLRGERERSRQVVLPSYYRDNSTPIEPPPWTVTCGGWS